MPEMVDIEVHATFRVSGKADWRDVLNAVCGLGALVVDIDGVPEEWEEL